MRPLVAGAVRTVFVTQWFDPEPGAARGLPLAKELERRGHAVKVLTGFPNYPGGKLYDGYKLRLRQWETMNGVRVLRVPLIPSHRYSIPARIANYGSFALSAASIGAALIGPADVGFVYHPPPTVGLPAWVLQRLRSIPFVYHISDMWPESVLETGALGNGRLRALVGGAINAWCDFVYRRAAAITVLSPGFKRLLVARGVPEGKIHVLYNWADEENFRVQARDETLSEKLGLAGRFNVVYAGNIGMYQGLETVIQAAGLLQDRPNVQIVIAGTGPDESRVRSLAAARGATNVKFLDRRPQSEMGAINAIADVLLVHLRDLEVFSSTIPGKTAVAMASGRPLLMAVRGDAADLVLRGECGLVAPPEDPVAMARAIRCLHDMPRRLREAMGVRGRQYYVENMGLQTSADAMDRLLRSVAANRDELVSQE